MLSASPLQNASLALLFAGLYFTVRAYRRLRRSSLPPGPSGLPIVGNIYDIPATNEWLAFMEMSRKYDSDVIALNLMGDTMIVLNSVTAINDLLEDRSLIYSDRPPFPTLNDLVGFTWHFAFMPYGPEWKERRKVFMQQFQPSQVLLHRPAELKAGHVLLQRLLESPEKYERHLRHMAGMVILSTAYGINIQPEDDPHIAISETALHAMACTGNRGSFWVDSFPILKYVPEFLPGSGFKQKAREWARAVTAMPKVPYEFVKRSRAAGMANSSIASRVLDDIEESGANQDEREKVLEDVLAACYAAGADTTVSALASFILAMTMFPEIQKKAQAAVDEVVGPNRLPDFEDNIPYVDAVARELLRWRPVFPLSVPHAVTADDVYKGYHIPAGAVVVGNSWAVLHDEKIYGPNTDRFIPERWLTESGEINKAIREPDTAFGFGRRICPGKDMAQWSLWICVASILAAFNITKGVDENGVPLEPSGEYTSGLLCWLGGLQVGSSRAKIATEWRNYLINVIYTEKRAGQRIWVNLTLIIGLSKVYYT
ncbi:cytochrome P450 [Mycena pura]|uniref:Cytochrome P450 n=1 Tax=Mycena pura TaxID=153505 RepID=A0AAD6VK42_9AGAR|nr:cytochrome P450 [Mycena pura]